MLIISLTTIPTRFHLIGPTLDSLVRQRAPVDRILLYIPRRFRRFPDYDGSLPEVPEGVEIRRVDDDLGPATKVLCAAREFADRDCDILFCDDDRIYPAGWAAAMLAARAERPGDAIAALGREASSLFASTEQRDLQPRAVKRAWQEDYWYIARHLWWLLRKRLPNPPDRPRRRVFKRSGYIDIFMGFGGVMVKPGFFDARDYDIPDICWTVDDFWLSGMLARKRIGIWVPADVIEPVNSDAYMVNALFAAEIDGVGRPRAEKTTFEYLRDTYGIWG